MLKTDGRVAATADRTIRLKRTRALWAPIVLLESYLVVTVLVFFFGPVDWDVPSAAKLVAFLAVNYGGLWLGYSWGLRRGRTALKQFHAGHVAMPRMPQQLKRLIVFSMIFTIVTSIVRLYAIRGGLEPVLLAFMNPGEAYREAQVIAQMDRDGELMALAGFSWAFRISTVLSVLNGLYFPLALVCWRTLSPTIRLLFVVALLCTIVFTVGLGLQSGIGFLLFSSLPVAVHKIYGNARLSTVRPTHGILVASETGLTRAWARVLVVALTCALVATVVLFQADRRVDSGRELNAADTLAGPFASPSDRWPITGTRLNYGLAMTCLYVSHGYEGLALAMELPFEWTYGLGWSRALQIMFRDYLGGPDLLDRSYAMRNSQQNGWPNSWWSTIFPWLASDTTYYGTPLFMVLIGFVIANVWVTVTVTGNPIGFAVLAQLFVLVFMFPANNALAQTLDSFFALIGVLTIYLVSRKYFDQKPTTAGRRGVRAHRWHQAPVARI